MIGFLKKNKKLLLILLKLCVATGCLVSVGMAQDWGEIRKIFKTLNIGIFMATLSLFFAGQLIVAIRWNHLLRIPSVEIGHGKAVKLHLLGLFYNNFLPSSIGGDFLRAWYVSRHTESSKKIQAAFSVFFDRALGLSAMFVLAVIGYFVVIYGQGFNIEAQGQETSRFTITSYLSAVYVIVGIFICLFLVVLLTSRGRGLALKVIKKAKVLFEKLIVSLKLYAKKPFSLAIAWFFTYVAQIMNIVGMWILGKHLGVDVSFKYYLVFFPLSWIIGAVPVSIGGIGVVEGLLTLLFVAAGSDAEPAFALSLCQRAILLLVALPGIYIHLVGAHLPGEEFFVDTNESIV